MDNIGESGLCCGGGGGHFLLINSLFNFGLGCVTISPPLQVWLINFVSMWLKCLISPLVLSRDWVPLKTRMRRLSDTRL